jgi:WD40 repeat protein
MDEVLQWKHKCTAVLTCRQGCGTQIYFDPNNKSSSGNYSQPISHFAITSDNSKIVSEAEMLKIWDLNTGKLLNTLGGHSSHILSITSDNSKIVSGPDNTIKIWDLNTGKLLNTLGGHSYNVTSLAITTDNSKIVSGSDDKTIKVWDLDTGKLLNTLEGHSKPVNFFLGHLREVSWTDPSIS